MDSRVAGLQGGCFPQSFHGFGGTMQSVHGQSQIEVDGRIIRPELGRLFEHPHRALVVFLLPQSRAEVLEGGAVLRIRSTAFRNLYVASTSRPWSKSSKPSSFRPDHPLARTPILSRGRNQ